MNLNYLAYFLISFVPLLIAIIWYHPNSLKLFNIEGKYALVGVKWYQWIVGFLLSGLIVYGNMLLVIHQLGFYELFFTDIMMGKEDSKLLVDEFLGEYGRKHRNFKHGVFHGTINAFIFALPFVVFNAFFEQKRGKIILLHFAYWLITSMVIGGLISEFI